MRRDPFQTCFAPGPTAWVIRMRSTAGTIRLAAAGVLLALVGVVGYFVALFHFASALPWLRNHALLFWVPVTLGGTLALLAVIRAPRGRRLGPSLLLGLEGLLAV